MVDRQKYVTDKKLLKEKVRQLQKNLQVLRLVNLAEINLDSMVQAKEHNV